MTKVLREGADSADRESSRTASPATGESFGEQIARVRLMSAGDPTWDLSDNDCWALHAVLRSHAVLLAALKQADGFITNGIELGFIRMPDANVPDPAKEVPGIVRAAIANAEGK